MNATIKTASKNKVPKRALSAVHETAADLYRLGFIDEHKMARYKALCMDPVADPSKPKIETHRERR